MTNGYRYAISLRIRHPAIDPAEITRTLQLEPYRCWRAGDPRTTPVGEPLDGARKESYWTSGDLIEGAWPGMDLACALGVCLDQLSKHREFFHCIRGEGGRNELFVGWYFLANSGDVLDCDLLARMADLKLDFAPDVYPPDQPQRDL